MESVFKRKILPAIMIAFAVILIGTVAYHWIEGWNWLDSVYFASTTLTTVGFGDFHPTHDLSKIFTIFYVLTGVSIVLYTLSVAGSWWIERAVERRLEKRESWLNASRTPQNLFRAGKERVKNSIKKKIEAHRQRYANKE